MTSNMVRVTNDGIQSTSHWFLQPYTSTYLHSLINLFFNDLLRYHSTILVWFVVDIPAKKSEKSKLSRVDFLGAFTLLITLVLLLLGLNSGGNIVPWTHPLVLVSLPLSIVSLLGFIYIEARIASEPVIPVKLLLNRTVAAACLTNWFNTMVVFAGTYVGDPGANSFPFPTCLLLNHVWGARTPKFPNQAKTNSTFF